jgi:geranylgeranyl diphosphate synthase, type II
VDLQKHLNEKKALVENRLHAIFSLFPDSNKTLRDAMEYSLFGDGKRIRPALAIAACESVGGDPEAVLPFACALEMIHTYSLIHDDLPCMDNDDLRRGRSTCHKVYGEAVALLAGDALLTEAFRVMTDRRGSGVSSSVGRRITNEIAKAAGAAGMVGGQTMDILYDRKKGTKAIVNFIHRNKTSALIRASVVAGALAGRARRKEVSGFAKYGEAVGMAFQIKDDLLDVEGNEEEVGKRLKKDVDKQTYVKHYGIAASKEKIEKLIRQAVSAIDFLGPNGHVLFEFAGFIGRRSS